MSIKFTNRTQAGQILSRRLFHYKDRSDVVILGLPRGGVPVAFEIARQLQAPLDVCLVRKLGVPQRPELAMGAIALGNVQVLNDEILQMVSVSPEAIQSVIDREKIELQRRFRLYCPQERSQSDPLRPDTTITSEKTVILVDDGIATGATIRAALSTLRCQSPSKIIIATPVAPPSVAASLTTDADEVICLITPDNLHSISFWYDDFSQTSDDEVRSRLAESRAIVAAYQPHPC